MKIYHNNGEIIAVWSGWMKSPSPNILGSSVIELDEECNRGLASLLISNDRAMIGLSNRYRVENGNIVNNDTDEVATISPNPQREAYKLSQLYGLTHEQLDTYIDNNMTDLQSVREIFRKALHVILYLVKQTKLDE